MACDEKYRVMKVIIVKEVKRSDGLWRFACGDVSSSLLKKREKDYDLIFTFFSFPRLQLKGPNTWYVSPSSPLSYFAQDTPATLVYMLKKKKKTPFSTISHSASWFWARQACFKYGKVATGWGY